MQKIKFDSSDEHDRIILELGVAKGLKGTEFSVWYYCNTSKIDQIEPIFENILK
jgi:hypothetical protein